MSSFALYVAIILLVSVPLARAGWRQSTPATPLPDGAVLISNDTLNPVAVYECAAPYGNRMVGGALAYEGSWKCVYYNESAPKLLSWVGPGKYQVYTDPFGSAHGTQATPESPFPSGTITPLFEKYPYATGCQTVWTEIIDGWPFYFPAYGSALPDESGNFACFGASFFLYAEGRFTKGGLPYNIAVD